VHRDARVAIELLAELLQHAALVARRERARLVIDRLRDLDGPRIAGARFDGDDALARGRQQFIGREVAGDLRRASEARQSRAGEDDPAVLAGTRLVDARVDISADVLDLQLREEHAELRAAARRARADDRARRHLGDRRVRWMEPHVARIGALEEAGQLEVRWDDRRHILEAVHRDVDRAALQRLFQFLDEEPFAADRRQRDVVAFVAGRLQHDELGLVAALAEEVRDTVRLPQREGRAAGPDPYVAHERSPKILRIVFRSDSRSCGSSDASLSCRIG
jgi:hypothetical protein